MEPATCPWRTGGYQSLTCRNLASGAVENYYAEPLEQKLPLQRGKYSRWNHLYTSSLVSYSSCKRVRKGDIWPIYEGFEQGFPVWNWMAIRWFVVAIREDFFNRMIQQGESDTSSLFIEKIKNNIPWEIFLFNVRILFFFFFGEGGLCTKDSGRKRRIKMLKLIGYLILNIYIYIKVR